MNINILEIKNGRAVVMIDGKSLVEIDVWINEGRYQLKQKSMKELRCIGMPVGMINQIKLILWEYSEVGLNKLT